MKVKRKGKELNINMDYIDKRTVICRNCSICDQENEICNPKLYINPDTNECSTTPVVGYIKGCGCRLKNKINNPKSMCPARKWMPEDL